MKKFLALLVAALMSISVLAACGTPKTEDVEENTAVEETVEEAAEEATEEETEEAETEETEEAEAEEKAE
ncbi:MAG: hypothetical protein K5768_00590 [Firmicutes bacterium]|nr:hypothetical protein [Bacillota bacterium]